MLQDNSKNIFQSRMRGISLIELSIFVVFFGLIVMAGALFYNTYEIHKHLNVTNTSVAQVQAALDAYYQKNGVFPCPAPLNVGIDNPGFAAANCAALPPPVTGRIVPPANPTGFINIGGVPTRTLGLPDSASMDGWKHLLTYAITQSYTTPGMTDMLSGSIYLQDSQGHFALPVPGTAVYAVAAANPDGTGAYLLNGQMPTPCPPLGPSLSSKICNAQGTVAAPFISTTLQGSQTTRTASNAIALNGVTCETVLPVPGGCGSESLQYPGDGVIPAGGSGPFPSTAQPLSESGYCIAAMPANTPINFLPVFEFSTPGEPGWTWSCNGSCLAPSSPPCTAAFCASIGAQCGTAAAGSLSTPPTATTLNLCAVGGTAGGFGSIPGFYTWTCAGSCYPQTGNVPPGTDCRNNPDCTDPPMPCQACAASGCSGQCGVKDPTTGVWGAGVDSCGNACTVSTCYCTAWYDTADNGSGSPGWLTAGTYLSSSDTCGNGGSSCNRPLAFQACALSSDSGNPRNTCGGYSAQEMGIGNNSTCWWPGGNGSATNHTLHNIYCHGRTATAAEISANSCAPPCSPAPLGSPNADAYCP